MGEDNRLDDGGMKKEPGDPLGWFEQSMGPRGVVRNVQRV